MPTTSTSKVTYRYDYLGRRVEKRVYAYISDPNYAWPTLIEDRRFVWGGGSAGVSPAGWLLLAEMRCTDPNDPCNCGTGFQPVKMYTWGLDLAGQSGSINSLEGAGGISGLLSVHDANDPADPNDPFGDRVYTYDANGNVGQLIDWSHDPNDPNGVIVAKYQYDPYGNPLHSVTDVNASGPYAPANPYRFSTKPFDDEIGWGYWGERYYDPKQGRWTNHDPIGELGGMNLYAYVRQSPIGRFDPLGHCIAGPDGLLGCEGEFGGPSGSTSAPTSGSASRPCPKSGDPFNPGPPHPPPCWSQGWPWSCPPWWVHDVTALDLASALHCAAGCAWGALGGSCAVYLVGGACFEIWEGRIELGWCETPVNRYTDIMINYVCCLACQAAAVTKAY